MGNACRRASQVVLTVAQLLMQRQKTLRGFHPWGQEDGPEEQGNRQVASLGASHGQSWRAVSRLQRVRH